MDYTVVSASEWTYPDVYGYATASKTIRSHAVRGGWLTAQVLLTGAGGAPETGLSGGAPEIRFSCGAEGAISEFEIELYEMVPVFVGAPMLETQDPKPLYPNRAGAFYVYDCIKPLDGTVTSHGGSVGLYISARAASGREPGVYAGSLNLACGGAEFKIPVEFTVHGAVLPDETLKFTNWYNFQNVAEYHKTEFGGGEYRRIDALNHKLMRRMHMNMLRVDGGMVGAKQVGEGAYEFDFSALEEYVKTAAAQGFKYFMTPAAGSRKSWAESTIYVKNGELPCLSYEAYEYLSQYFAQFGALLRKNGWEGMFYVSAADEPNEANAVEFRALCGIVRRLLPGVKLFDAMSYGPFYGSVDVCVPLNSEYEKHRDKFERFRAGGDEIWHYVCCGPRHGGYVNRFMDYPLLATRYLFWGNYKYGLTGYLHWAFNQYQPGQDPFTDNWPVHRNADSVGRLPPGDTHLVYPGDGMPWMSMRLEAQRESAEDYEILRAIAEKDRAAADGLCGKCFRSFNDVENDPAAFDKVRIEMFEALDRVQARA